MGRSRLLIADYSHSRMSVLQPCDERNLMSEIVPVPSESSTQPTALQTAPPQVTYVQVVSPPKSASITSMVLGLVSIVMGFTFFLPLLGLIFSFVGLAKEPAGRVYAIVGLLLNGFFILMWGLVVVLALGVFGLVAAPTWSSY